MITYSDLLDRIWVGGFPMCTPYGDTEEMDLGHIQKYQSLRDDTDKASNRDKWWNVSMLCWTAGKKTVDVAVSDVG
jgi:hypothetical protein